MRITYHDLVGMQVIGADGRRVGSVVDLVAEKRGEALCVTALRVGLPAFMRRIAFRRTPKPAVCEIAWTQVARVEERIHLRINAGDLQTSDAAGPLEEHPAC